MKKPGDAAGSEGRALLLAPEAPFPLAGGGALRTASLLEYLARRYAVDMIVFREPGALDPRLALPSGLVEDIQVINLPYNSRRMPARAARNAGRIFRRVPPLLDRFAGFEQQVSDFVRDRRYDVSVVEHFWCAPYWKSIAPNSRTTVLDLHNVESVLHRRCGRLDRRPTALAHRLFHRACLKLERLWFPRYSCLLAASEEDAVAVREISPQSRVIIYRNALPLVATPSRAEEDVIVFSGNLEYHPNVSAVRFFRRKIWPLLRERWPNLKWRLVGKNPHGVWRYTAGDPRIEVTGAVDDAITELSSAKVAVVPLLSGSGTRVKIMEAWAAARPVVSTTLGAEGLPIRDGENILLADEPAHFAHAVSSLLSSPDLRRRIGEAGRALFEKEFTWEAAWSRLDL